MVTATLKFYPSSRKINPISKKAPVYCRILSGNKKAESRLPIELTPEELLHWNEQIGRVDLKGSRINSYLNATEDAFMQFKIQHATDSKIYSAKDIRDEILGANKNKSITILDFAKNYYLNNVDKNSKFAPSTKRNYRKAIKHFERFIMKKRLKQTSIQNLDYDFAKSFTSYLMNDDPKNDRIGMSEISACGINKKFRTIFNEAVDSELINRNPFLKIKLSYRSPEKPKLSLAHFQNFLHPINLIDAEKRISNIFLFMSLTGCAFNDCMNLIVDNLEVSDEGTMLRYNRNKSGVESTQYLTEKALELLEEFSTIKEVYIPQRLVPKISNQQMNRTLKLLAAKYGITFKLSSHDSRHTYRQLLDESDIVDPTVICKLMGWSNKDRMDSIYRKVTDSRLLKTKEQFNFFIQNQINKDKI
ncbi:MAG: site-specific integrase [Crocinitomicaceae bacterium]|nr:site-specific integrase [Crocinitomicaceae bacterium]